MHIYISSAVNSVLKHKMGIILPELVQVNTGLIKITSINKYLSTINLFRKINLHYGISFKLGEYDIVYSFTSNPDPAPGLYNSRLISDINIAGKINNQFMTVPGHTIPTNLLNMANRPLLDNFVDKHEKIIADSIVNSIEEDSHSIALLQDGIFFRNFSDILTEDNILMDFKDSLKLNDIKSVTPDTDLFENCFLTPLDAVEIICDCIIYLFNN